MDWGQTPSTPGGWAMMVIAIVIAWAASRYATRRFLTWWVNRK